MNITEDELRRMLEKSFDDGVQATLDALDGMTAGLRALLKHDGPGESNTGGSK